MIHNIHNRKGFTLIEVMAAMAILAVILLVAGRVMVDATDAYDAGVSTSEVNDSGRAIFDFIIRDIATAISGESNTTLSVKSSASFDYGYGDEVRFVSLSKKPESSERSSTEVVYYMRPMVRRDGITHTNRFQLMRAEQSSVAQMDSYINVDWGDASSTKSTGAVIAENVSRFYVYTYVLDTNYAGNAVLEVSAVNHPGLGTPTDFKSTGIRQGTLPLFVDVYLEMLGEKDSIQIGVLADQGVDVEDRVKDRAKRFFGRVYLHNRMGYMDE